MSITIEVRKDRVEAELARLTAKLNPQRLAAAIGPGMARLVQRHFLKLGKNKRNWPTTNFWPRAARATSWEAVDGGALVRVSQIGVRQRYKGGPIGPVRRQYLAIPISPVSYGKVPSDFPGLFLLPTKKGAYLVQYGTGSGAAPAKGKTAAKAVLKRGLGGNVKVRRDATMNFLFKLSRGVTQARDEDVIPTKDELGKEAVKLITAAVKPNTK